MKKLGFRILLGAMLISFGVFLTSCQKETFKPGTTSVITATDNFSVSDSVYDFPVKPGMAAWGNFETHEQMLKACMIPSGILKSLSTKGLIKTCLAYPLLVDIIAYDNMQDGYNAILSGFNGLQDVLERGDASSVLLEIYSKTDPLYANSATFADKNDSPFQLMAMEMILAQDEIIKRLSLDEKNKLIYLTVKKHKLMLEDPYSYGLYSFIPQNLIIYRTLEQVGVTRTKGSNPDMDYYVKNGNLPTDLKIVEEIFKMATDYLTTIGFTSYNTGSTLKGAKVCNYSSGNVYTPKFSAVNVNVYNCEPMSPAEISNSNAAIIKTYPKAKFIATSTGKYNCHSYAWFSQSTSNYRWMNDPSKYWKDGSFYQVYICAPGLIWTYGGTTHSAIANSNAGKPLQSKWGKGPLMAHDYAYCPYPSSNLRTYKRK